MSDFKHSGEAGNDRVNRPAVYSMFNGRGAANGKNRLQVKAGKNSGRRHIRSLVLYFLVSGLAPAFSYATTATPVTIAGFAYQPDKVSIKAGQTVTWTNKDVTAHTVTGTKGDWDSGNLATGASYSKTFSKPGTYEYVCAIHPNMTGVIVVQ